MSELLHNFKKLFRKIFSIFLSILILMGATSYDPGISAVTIVCGTTPGYQNCSNSPSCNAFTCSAPGSRCSGIGTNLCCCPVLSCNDACMSRDVNSGPPGVKYTSGTDGTSSFPPYGCSSTDSPEHFPRTVHGIVGMNQVCCCMAPAINCDNSATGGCMGYFMNGVPFSPTNSNPTCGSGFEKNAANTCCCPIDCSINGICAGYNQGAPLSDGASSCTADWEVVNQCCCGPCIDPPPPVGCRMAMREVDGKTIKYLSCPIPSPSSTPSPTASPSSSSTSTGGSSTTSSSSSSTGGSGCFPGQINCGKGCVPTATCCSSIGDPACPFEVSWCDVTTNTCKPLSSIVTAPTPSPPTFTFPTPSPSAFASPTKWTVVCPLPGIRLVQPFNPNQIVNYIGLPAGTVSTWMIGDSVTLGSQTFTISGINPANAGVSFDMVILNQRPTTTYTTCSEVFYTSGATRASSPNPTERGTYTTVVKKTLCESIDVSNNLFPSLYICKDGLCSDEDEVCGLSSAEDSFGRELLKCGCHKKCSSLNAPFCSEGYCYPDVCGVIPDPADTSKTICGCVKKEDE